jgi:uncharacterized protein
MLEARRPGLYVERAPAPPVLAPLRSDIAAFAGRTRRGPVGVAVRLEGWREFERVCGGLGSSTHLSYAVRGYFENGGQVGYVLRVGRVADVDDGALPRPFVHARQSMAFGANSLEVIAASPGTWANGARVVFSLRRSGAGVPRLTIRVETDDEPDEFIGPIKLEARALAEEPGDSDLDPLVRAIANRSDRIRVDTSLADMLAYAVQPRTDWTVALGGGIDGATTQPLYLDALTTLCDQPEPALLTFPDLGLDIASESDRARILSEAILRCEELKDRIVLTEMPAQGDEFDHPPLDFDATVSWAQRLRNEDLPGGARYAAFYHPWLRVSDPLGGVVAPLRDVPPCGHVAGVVSRSDRERGASYTPANLPVYDAVDVSRSFVEPVETEFNRLGINMIRCAPGQGLMVWGGGTLARSSTLDERENRFVAHRRLINRLVRAIRRVAEPLVFDSNGPELWLTIYRGVNSVLFEAFQHGALKGSRPEEAYQIRCDAQTNPPESIDLGQVLCEIDVAPAAPMEYILLRLSFAGDGRLEVFES